MMGFQVRNLLFLLVPFSGSILIFRGVLSLKPMAAAATANHTNPFATPLLRMFTGCNVCNPCRHYSSFYVLRISVLYWKVDPTYMARPSFVSIFKHCARNKVDVTTIYLGLFSNCDACPRRRMHPNGLSHIQPFSPPTGGTPLFSFGNQVGSCPRKQPCGRSLAPPNPMDMDDRFQQYSLPLPVGSCIQPCPGTVPKPQPNFGVVFYIYYCGYWTGVFDLYYDEAIL